VPKALAFTAPSAAHGIRIRYVFGGLDLLWSLGAL